MFDNPICPYTGMSVDERIDDVCRYQIRRKTPPFRAGDIRRSFCNKNISISHMNHKNDIY